MKPRFSLILATLLGAVFFMGASVPAHAVIRIYRVTFMATALLHPAGAPSENFTDVGYLIYDTAAPANSETVQVFSRTKTYQLNGNMLSVIFPSQIALGVVDENGDGTNDTEVGIVGFVSGPNNNTVSARSYIGAVPKAGFRVGDTTVFGTAPTLHGKGSVAVLGGQFYTVSDTWTFDHLSVTGNPATANAGVALVQAVLQAKGYNQLP